MTPASSPAVNAPAEAHYRLPRPRSARLRVVLALGAGAALAAHKPVLAAALGSSAGILAGLFLRRIRRAHFSWEADCLSLAGLPVFSYLLLRSVWSYRRGKLTWKGRSYAPAASAMANGRPQ